MSVYVHPGIVEHAARSLNDEEVARVQALCTSACENYFAAQPGQSATCADPDAFETPVEVTEDVKPALDLVASSRQNGSGIFTGQQLTCQVGQNCQSFFDEALGEAVPRRWTSASAAAGVGEEYRVALGTASKIEVVTNVATYSSRLTGSVGYSFCKDGSASAACPFYLGSFDALASANISPRVRCADSSIVQVTLSNLLVKLAQPAFGIAKGGSGQTAKGFPAGGLVFESSFDVGREHHVVRRSSRNDVQVTASGTTFQANNITMTTKVPCNGSAVNVTVRVTARDPGNGSAIGKPPVVSINTPSSVTCGAVTTLSATATDPNGDLDTLRWYLDNVLLAPSTTTVVLTRQHTLRAVARDLRGAATTAKKVVSCL